MIYSVQVYFTRSVAVEGTLIPDISIFAQLTDILKIRIAARQFSQPDHLMTENPDRAVPALLIPVVEQRCIHTDMCTADPWVFFDGFEKSASGLSSLISLTDRESFSFSSFD